MAPETVPFTIGDSHGAAYSMISPLRCSIYRVATAISEYDHHGMRRKSYNGLIKYRGRSFIYSAAERALELRVLDLTDFPQCTERPPMDAELACEFTVRVE